MTARKTTQSPCILADCPVQAKPAGCGFVAAGTPCRDPKHRDEWDHAQRETEEEQTDDDYLEKLGTRELGSRVVSWR